MADNKTDTQKTGALKDSLKEGLKFGVKEGIAAAGGTFGILAMLKNYFFPNNSADVNQDAEGMQADKKGRGMTDEMLFDVALAKASEEIEPDHTKRNELVKRFLVILNQQLPTVRRNAILRVGLTENRVDGKDADGKASTNIENTRGIAILKLWLRLDDDALKLALQSPVLSSDIFVERVNKVNDVCHSIHQTLQNHREEKKNRPDYLTPAEKAKKISNSPLGLLKTMFK